MREIAKTTLADRMFESMIMNSNQTDLNMAYFEIDKLQTHMKFRMESFPFVKNLFKLVVDEYEYRKSIGKNQTENNIVHGTF